MSGEPLVVAKVVWPYGVVIELICQDSSYVKELVSPATSTIFVSKPSSS